ncbi:hypothetical protein [Beduinella massiliensis]|uniref:hypothetical protein n=1 Tax=Beduinella massiliensis TaxID=1852363 RepID=UPI000C83E01F
MQIEKKVLCSLEQPYSVSPFTYEGEACCLAASEGVDGPCCILTAQGPVTLRGALAGGCMNLVAVPECENTFLTIQRFYPVFKSEGAQVVLVRVGKRNADGTADCEVTKLCDLPFAHRIALCGEPGSRYLVAGVLCRAKAFTGDWSQPGYVAAFPLDVRAGTVGEMEMILDTLHKNHGLSVQPQSGPYELIVSGEEGVFAVSHEGGVWKTACILPQETSDVCMTDLEGDGGSDLLTIQGFHGSAFNVWGREDGGWQKIYTHPLAFGHVLWCGRIGRCMCALSGSRLGDKELTLHVFYRAHGRIGQEESTVLDAPCAPTQVAVQPIEGGARIYAANTEQGEIACYTVTHLQ